METIHGTITEIIFRNDENAYSVVEIRSQRDAVTVIGAMPEMTPGEKASFEGEWTEHPQYGRQFKASACRMETPTTLGGIERYLASGLIKGVGPTTARLIVSEFGEETLAVM
ncbi:MAG: ATP-dependent RecD-like DNA helicase, partial [Clostridiales bacterium]|nr:ATP-dependent RecD-like DNA helicase [Clostridiales bacterium]